MNEETYNDGRGKDTEARYTRWSDGVWTRTSYHIESGKVYEEVEIPYEAVPFEIRKFFSKEQARQELEASGQ